MHGITEKEKMNGVRLLVSGMNKKKLLGIPKVDNSTGKTNDRTLCHTLCMA